MSTVSAGATRPGASRLLDPAVAQQLLLRGDDVHQAPAPALKHLHLLVAASTPAAVQSDSDHDLSDSDNGILSDPEETLAQEERLERRVAALRKKFGLRNDKTLKQVFKLLDCLIGQYKLNRTEKILGEVQETCHSLGGDWRVKHIQSLAFCRWKQYKFK